MKKSPEAVRNAAIALFKDGKNYQQIAKALGITGTTAHVLVDEKFAEHRRASVNASRQGRSIPMFKEPRRERPISLAPIPPRRDA